MAKLLISFPQRAGPPANADPNQPPGQPKSEPYRVALNEEVLEEIKQNFAGLSEVAIVMSFGNSQCGRASTLEAFLGEGNEGSFSSEDKPPGVYAWMRPVPLNNVNLLLVKMWSIDFLNEQDEELDLINEKVMIALMSISSICLFCGDRNTMFQSLTAIYEMYTPIKERLHLEMSIFLVFVEKEATLASSSIKRQREIFNKREFENPPEILYRGRDGISATCKETLLQIVGNLQNHRVFLDSHRRVMEAIRTPDMINALGIILKIILDISRINLDFQNFIDKMPNFINPNYHKEIQRLVEIDEISKSVLSGYALDFFEEARIASRSYKIRESVFYTLHANYQTDKPIIVMPIFGNQSKGKSTLLNHIVRHLLGCSNIPQLFKIGNTGIHTTRASQVLSYPLKLGAYHLMLVDLEGLEGMETEDTRFNILQENLISALMTIASVPCILVDNDIRKIDFVKKIVETLSNLQNYFGYKIERVHVLFHDRDLGADINPDFERHIQDMNQQYFSGKIVLKLRNKPNFIEESKTVVQEEFLRYLMQDSHFPKQSKHGSPVSLKQLLVEMRYITEYKNVNMSEISLTVPELKECNACAHEKSLLLREIFENVQGDDENRSLEFKFDAESRHFLWTCSEELLKVNVNWTRRAFSMLETEVASHRAKIMEIQRFHEMITDLSQFDLLNIMTKQLDNLYRKYWYVSLCNRIAPEMKKIVLTDKQRYSKDSHRMNQIIEEFEEKQASIEKHFYLNYGWQAGIAFVSDVFGRGYKPVTSNSAGVSDFIYNKVSKNLAFEGKAVELVTIDKPGWLSSRTPIRLNSDAIRELEERNRPVMVFLMIAAKKIQASSMLNEFIRCVVPFTSSTVITFNDSRLTQILHFDYKDRRACIIYLKIKLFRYKAKYKAVETIAVSLIQKASFTCLFMDSFGSGSNIIKKAFSSDKISRSEEAKRQFNPRVAVIYPEKISNKAFIVPFEMDEIRYIRIPVSDLSAESLKCPIVVVKDAFDESTPIESQALLEALRDAERAANEQ